MSSEERASPQRRSSVSIQASRRNTLRSSLRMRSDAPLAGPECCCTSSSTSSSPASADCVSGALSPFTLAILPHLRYPRVSEVRIIAGKPRYLSEACLYLNMQWPSGICCSCPIMPHAGSRVLRCRVHEPGMALPLPAV